MYMGTAILRRGPIYYKTLELQKAKELERINHQRMLNEAEAESRRQAEAIAEQAERTALLQRNASSIFIKSISRLFKQPRPTRDQILDATALYFNIPVSTLQDDDRRVNVVLARQVLFYVCVKIYGYSLCETARLLTKDHTTVLHGVRAVAKKRFEKPAYMTAIHAIRASLAAVVPYEPFFWGS